jgi:hypothetical protein
MPNLEQAKKNVELLKGTLRRESQFFEMGVWCEFRACGTAQCVGGTAQVLFFGKQLWDSISSTSVFCETFAIEDSPLDPLVILGCVEVLFFPADPSDASPRLRGIWSTFVWEPEEEYDQFDVLPPQQIAEHACTAIDNMLAHLISIGAYNAN